MREISTFRREDCEWKAKLGVGLRRRVVETADSPSPERSMEELIHDERTTLLHGPKSEGKSYSVSDRRRDDVRCSFRVGVGGGLKELGEHRFYPAHPPNETHDVRKKLLGDERTGRSEGEGEKSKDTSGPEPEEGERGGRRRESVSSRFDGDDRRREKLLTSKRRLG